MSDEYTARLKRWAALELDVPLERVTRVSTETVEGCETCEHTTAEVWVSLDGGELFWGRQSFSNLLEAILKDDLDEEGLYSSWFPPTLFTLKQVHWEERSQKVLNLVMAERHGQVARYGLNGECADGTGPEVEWLHGTGVNLDLRTAEEIEAAFRHEYEKHGFPDWMRLIREEVAEAFKESDPARLKEELIQVAALCVSWVESLDRRVAPVRGGRGGSPL